MATYLITGANRGIGCEMARQLAQRGEVVIGCCRQASDELNAIDGVEVREGLDVTDENSVAELAEALADRTIDVLVNNAGVIAREGLDDLDFDRAKQVYDVNALGPLRVTRALLGQLADGGKVGIITSRVGSIADNGSGGNYAYRMSKAAVNMAGVNLSLDLKERGVAVFLLHPGMVRTRMTEWTGIDPSESAAGLIERLDGLTLRETGGFYHQNGQPLPW